LALINHALGFRNLNPRHVWPYLLGRFAPPRGVGVLVLVLSFLLKL
jgi:hypothetical protein